MLAFDPLVSLAASKAYAAMKFARLVGDSSDAAGLRLYGMVNLRFSDEQWIQPDFAMVRRPLDGMWVEAKDVVVVGEFTAPSARRDQRALCATFGIPYYLTGETSRLDKYATLQLFRLAENGYQLVKAVGAGGRFEVDKPFPMSFDPIQLLDL
jgi:hypothetical protein